MPPNEVEVHDPQILARARALLDACQTAGEMQEAVLKAVKRNETWRGEQCINLLASVIGTLGFHASAQTLRDTVVNLSDVLLLCCFGLCLAKGI